MPVHDGPLLAAHADHAPGQRHMAAGTDGEGLVDAGLLGGRAVAGGLLVVDPRDRLRRIAHRPLVAMVDLDIGKTHTQVAHAIAHVELDVARPQRRNLVEHTEEPPGAPFKVLDLRAATRLAVPAVEDLDPGGFVRHALAHPRQLPGTPQNLQLREHRLAVLRNHMQSAIIHEDGRRTERLAADQEVPVIVGRRDLAAAKISEQDTNAHCAAAPDGFPAATVQ